jgi:DNA primase
MKYRFPEEFVNRVREANDLIEVASEYMTLVKSGDRYRGLCPFHREDTPSFNISADKQLYHCFGCGAGGNVITFIMNIENLSFIDAVKMLADRCRLPIPEKGLEKGVSERYKTAGRILEANVAAARYYARCLKEAKRAMDYLTGRGLNYEIIRRFGLGYAPGDGGSLLSYLKRAGFEPDIVEKAGLAGRSKSGVLYDRFRDRIMFPIIDVRGRVIGFGGRMMGDGKGAKYLNSPETPVFYKGSTLYGLNRAKKHIVKGELIVVEGYMDVISLHRHGVENAVASLGTAFTQRQAEIIKRYSANVIVAYDSDAAGQAATQRGMEILERMGCKVRILQLPEGKDPDEYIKANGREAFLKLVSAALPLTDYRIALLEKKYDLDDMGGKVEFLKEAAAVLAKLDSELERTEYIRMVAQRAKTYEAALREEVLRLIKKDRGQGRNISGKNRHNNNDREYSYSVKAANVEAEKTLLALMLSDKKLRGLIAERIKKEDFTDPLHARLYELLKSAGGDRKIEDADIINSFQDRQEANRVAALMQHGLPAGYLVIYNKKNDCIHTITVHKYRLRSDFLKGEIKRLADRGMNRTKGEEEQYRGYCEEFMDIQRRLKGL